MVDGKPSCLIIGMLRNTRLLYIAESYSTHDERFLKAIADHVQETWYANTGRDTDKNAIKLPAKVTWWPGQDQSINAWQALIHELGVNMVHVCPINGSLSIIRQHVDCPLVAMSMASDILLERSLDHKDELIKAMSSVDAFIIDCDAVRRQIENWLTNSSVPIVQFPYGIELARFQELPMEASQALREKLEWTQNDVMISTRSWSSQYGILALLKAFSFLTKSHPMTRLLLVGDGPLRKDVLTMIEDLGLKDKVFCPGRVPEGDLPVYYGAADLYVSSSLCDGVSVSMLEAMACALPVLAHDEFGNLEWIKNGENGWLVDCRRPELICEALETAFASPASLKMMGRLNRQKVLRDADWSKHSSHLSSAYRVAQEHYLAKSLYAQRS